MPEMLVFGTLLRTRAFPNTMGAMRGVVEKEKPLLFLLKIPRAFMGGLCTTGRGRGRAGFDNGDVERRCLLGDLDGKQL